MKYVVEHKMPKSFAFRVTKKIDVPVTTPLVLNGTPKVCGSLDGKPIYGYRKTYVDLKTVVYAETEKDAITILYEEFGSDISIDIV